MVTALIQMYNYKVPRLQFPEVTIGVFDFNCNLLYVLSLAVEKGDMKSDTFCFLQ